MNQNKTTMKNTIVSFLIFFVGTASFACEVCERNQPKPLKGITHGPGPSGSIDYFIAAVAIVTVGLSLFLAIKYLVRPKEGEPDHIKNIVLNEY